MNKYENRIKARGLINDRYYATVRYHSQIISRKQFVPIHGQKVLPGQTALQFLRMVMPNGFHFLPAVSDAEPVLFFSTILRLSKKKRKHLRITNQDSIHPAFLSVSQQPTSNRDQYSSASLSYIYYRTEQYQGEDLTKILQNIIQPPERVSSVNSRKHGR